MEYKIITESEDNILNKKSWIYDDKVLNSVSKNSLLYIIRILRKKYLDFMIEGDLRHFKKLDKENIKLIKEKDNEIKELKGIIRTIMRNVEQEYIMNKK